MAKKKTQTLIFLWIVTLVLGSIRIHPTQAFQAEGDIVPIRANDLFAARPTRAIWQAVDPDGAGIEYLRGRAENVTFETLCNGDFALLATSVTPTADQLSACGHPVIEMMIALDGAVLIASPGVDFTSCLTVEEAYAVWGAGGETRWNAVNPDYPDRSVSAYIPDRNADTLEFFEQIFLSEAGGLRDDTFPLGTDQDRRIQDRQSAVGFIPLARYLPDAEAFTPLSFDSGQGCIAPTDESFADGSYPLSAPVFWYVLSDSPWLENENLINFIHYALSDDGRETVLTSGSTPPPNDYTVISLTNFDNQITGPVISDPSSAGSDLVIRLTWQSNHDLDLGVQLPDGGYVGFMNPSESGIYRVASNGNEHCAEVTSNASEEIVFAEGSAVDTETYFAFVQQSFKCNADTDAANFTLEFIVDGEVVKTVQGSVEGENNFVEGYTFMASEG